jgi:hypothetical protein
MFLPIINKGKQNLNKCEFQLVVTSIFYIFFFGITISIVNLIFLQLIQVIQ